MRHTFFAHWYMPLDNCAICGESREAHEEAHNPPTRERIAVLKSNGARFAICEVTDTHITLQGWQHRETLTLRDFAICFEVREVQAS